MATRMICVLSLFGHEKVADCIPFVEILFCKLDIAKGIFKKMLQKQKIFSEKACYYRNNY